MSESVLDLVVRHRKGQTYGVHAVLAALETEPPGVPHAVHLARTVTDLAAAVTAALDAGRRVLVLWSFYSPDAAAAADELEQVRALVRAHGPHPGPDRLLHLAGGVHASTEPLATLRSGFDLVAVGEGERTLTSLAAAFARGDDVRGTAGTAHLGPDGALVRAAPAPRLPLDTFRPFPYTRNLTNPIEITRGCIYACRFCATPFIFSARFRHRSVGQVREAVQVMRARGLRDVRFVTPSCLSYGSPDGGVDLAAVDELLGAARDAIGPQGRVFFGSFPSELRPEHVSAEALRVLVRHVSNRDVIVGAQSGSDDVLRLSGRGHGVEVVERAVRLCVEAGLRPNVDMIFGMPGEGPDEAMATVRLMERLHDLGARTHAHTFMPLPGTPWRDEPAGRIDPRARAALARASTRGAVYGSWERQEQVADRIAQVRAATAGHRARRPRHLLQCRGDAAQPTAPGVDPRPAGGAHET